MAENIDSFVIDASFILAFLLPDEKTSKVDKIFSEYKDGKIKLLSTELLPFEVLNGLKSALLRKRIKRKEALVLVNAFVNLDITLEKIDIVEVFDIRAKKLSFYDASYLYLSKINRFKLLSLDKYLIKLSSGNYHN
ncbi:MAG: hypothetical protein UT63_C0054G0008 [Candidatus Gottesmanbacteria bacterium GW2011_GWC2_39_8]|uniref:PIN domain-containing protein n=1 Tax=Candidatus Gottesmanbacteria bacterium GW2011_GWC2_39_8 TaxID=1618450 RepID=A0A0G0Q3R5_9BACT|nr:MAG: hypothetical protein UT63_C0054G0008 [Candidatus Gottesmanbacteria bacterium GW2011_GWC2_39_8]